MQTSYVNSDQLRRWFRSQKPGHVYTGSSHGRNTAFSFSYSLGWGVGVRVNIDAHSVSLSASVHLELRRSLESEQAGRNSRQSSAVVPHLPPLGSPTQNLPEAPSPPFPHLVPLTKFFFFSSPSIHRLHMFLVHVFPATPDEL